MITIVHQARCDYAPCKEDRSAIDADDRALTAGWLTLLSATNDGQLVLRHFCSIGHIDSFMAGQLFEKFGTPLDATVPKQSFVDCEACGGSGNRVEAVPCPDCVGTGAVKRV